MMGQAKPGFVVRQRLCSLNDVQKEVKEEIYREGGTDGSAEGKILRGNSRDKQMLSRDLTGFFVETG